MKKKELIFIISILVFAGFLWMGINFFSRGSCGSIRITVDGQQYGVYSLSENQTIPIGNTNVCEIRDGTVRMTEADCPDHLCIKQKPVDADGGTIVCLPNKVIIEGEKTKSNTSGFDAVT